MKKNLVLFAIIGVAMITISGCGKDPITVVGANGTEYETYQDCCAAHDFEAAHSFLAKMESRIDSYKERLRYNTAKEYVFKQESLYLMSIGGEAAQKRISYLLKEAEEGEEGEKGGNDRQIEMLIDLAIENEDDEFVKVLANKLKQPSDNCIVNVVTYLTREKDGGNNDYIISLINSFPIDGTKPRPGLAKYFDNEAAEYKESVAKFNGRCDRILDVAINSKNKSLALSILNLYKEDVGRIVGGDGEKAPNGTKVDGDHSYVWFYNQSKSDAQKKYNEAVKSGTFQ